MADGRYVDASGNTVPGATYQKAGGALGWSIRMPADGSAGTPVGPQDKPALTSQQSAQKVIDRYWAWANAGGKTVELPDPANPGKTTTVAVDPATSRPDPAFPTIQDITAARAEVGTKAANDPKGAADLDETLKRTELLQTQIDAAKAKTTTPGKTQAQIDQEAADAHANATKPDKPTAPPLSQTQVDAQAAAGVARDNAGTNLANAQAGAVETPAQVLQRVTAQATATARAQGQAAIDQAQALVASGITMTEADKAALTAKLAGIQSDHDAAIQQAQSQFDFDQKQPNVLKDQAVAQQTADTASAAQQANAASQQASADQADRNTRTDVLKAQAAQGSGLIDTLVKAGVHVPMGAINMAYNPLQAALQLSRQQVQSGKVPPSAMPTPSAPLPAGAAAPAGAPLPAPGLVPPSAPPPEPAYMYGAGPGPINQGV